MLDNRVLTLPKPGQNISYWALAAGLNKRFADKHGCEAAFDAQKAACAVCTVCTVCGL